MPFLAIFAGPPADDTPAHPTMPMPSWPVRAAVAAFALAVAPMPADAGYVGTKGGPRTANRYLFRQGVQPGPYALVVPPPHDEAAAQEPVPLQELPDRAPPPRRTAPIAYAITEGPPPDAGTLPIPASTPDRARGPARAGWLPNFAKPPPDAGTLPIPASMPDRAKAAPRAGWLPSFATPPPDSGSLSFPDSAPDLARGPVRASSVAYALHQQTTRPDAGLDQPVVAPVTPDRARPPQRTAGLAYAIAVSSPVDAGVILGDPPAVVETPDRALRAARAASTAYAIGEVPQQDAGTLPIPASMPERAKAAPRAGWLPSFATSPQDAGLPQPIVLPSWPDRAKSAARAAPAVYAVVVPSPVDAGVAAVVDTFSDVSGTVLTAHTPDQGGTWTIHPSYAGHTNVITAASRVRGDGTTVSSLHYWSGTPGSADYSVAADVFLATNAGRGGVAGRINTAADTYYYAQYSAPNLELGSNVAGSPTVLATVNPGWSASSTHHLVLSIQGSSISVWIDGSPVLGPVTDTSITATGKAGVTFFVSTLPSDVKYIHLDNFDVGSAIVIPPSVIQPVIPDVARTARRTAGLAYSITVPTPVDAGSLAFPARTPDRALAPRPAAQVAYAAHQQSTPRDAGLQQPIIPAITPDRAPMALRATRNAYAIALVPPFDQGVVIGDMPAVVEAPDRASGPRRGAWIPSIVPTPGDPGTRPIPASAPDRAPAPTRAAWIPAVVPAPPDPGTSPVPVSMPDRARAASRAAWIPSVVPSPGDPGVAACPAVFPDRASAASYRSTAYVLCRAGPMDEGIALVPTPIATALPERARAAARAAWAPSTVPSPRDAGLLPIPAVTPDRARPAARTSALAYVVVVAPPRDAGLAQPIIPACTPDRAPAPRRAAPAAYAITVPSQHERGLGLVYNVYLNTGAGDPINYTSIVDTSSETQWESDALTYPGTWKIGIRAKNLNVSLEEKNIDAVVTIQLDGSGTDVGAMPIAPLLLSGHAASGGDVVLDWQYRLLDAARKPAGFHIYRGTGGTPSYVTPVATVTFYGALQTYSTRISGQSDGVAYTFGVRAYNATGEEVNTASITITADATGPPPVYALTGGTI